MTASGCWILIRQSEKDARSVRLQSEREWRNWTRLWTERFVLRKAMFFSSVKRRRKRMNNSRRSISLLCGRDQRRCSVHSLLKLIPGEIHHLCNFVPRACFPFTTNVGSILVNNLQKCRDGIKKGKINRDKNGYSIDHRAFSGTVTRGEWNTSVLHECRQWCILFKRGSSKHRSARNRNSRRVGDEEERKKRATAIAIRRLAMLGKAGTQYFKEKIQANCWNEWHFFSEDRKMEKIDRWKKTAHDEEKKSRRRRRGRTRTRSRKTSLSPTLTARGCWNE